MEKKHYYIALTGAKKNMGDFLITKRAIALIKGMKSDCEVVTLNNWESLDDNLDLINNSRGVIILGGPGYAENMYPGTYKLTKDLDDILVPIYYIGGGWYGQSNSQKDIDNYSYNETSLKLLSRISKSSEYMSARDKYTKQTLEKHGFNNVLVTGCPVFYDLDYIEKEYQPPSEFKNIVFTPAQHKKYKRQSIRALKKVLKVFDGAQVFVSFNRGIGFDEKTPNKTDAKTTTYIAKKATQLGCKIVDTSYDLKRIEFYDDCDLHVGYRVHSHVYFLSHKKTSILINEDARGVGINEFIGIDGINAFQPNVFVSSMLKLLTNNKIKRYIINRKLQVRLNHDLLNLLEYELYQIKNGWLNKYAKAGMRIDQSFKIMQLYIKSIN